MLSGWGRWQPAPTRNASQDEAVDRLIRIRPLIRRTVVIVAARDGHVEEHHNIPTDPIPDKTSVCNLYKGYAFDLLVVRRRLLVDRRQRREKHQRPVNRPFDFVPETADRQGTRRGLTSAPRRLIPERRSGGGLDHD